MQRTRNDDAAIDAFRQSIDRVLCSLLPDGAPVALVDFPDHSNVGDHAIWLGTRAALERSGHRVVYACTRRSYDRQTMREHLGDGIILLQGGGNFGDIWPAYQIFREQVVGDFSRNRIVMLPQSVAFDDEASLARARSIFNEHEDLTLLLRDHASLEVARREFPLPSVLCPDMAFHLPVAGRVHSTLTPVLWLAREDVESRWDGVTEDFGHDVRRTDWIADDGSEPRELSAFDGTATMHVERGLTILSRGRVVVTDRLHGHILSLLLGIPHVVLDNSYGKIRSFVETWTSASPLVRWADSPEEALEIARSQAGRFAEDQRSLVPAAQEDHSAHVRDPVVNGE